MTRSLVFASLVGFGIAPSASAGVLGPSRAELQAQIEMLEIRIAGLEAAAVQQAAADPAVEAETAAAAIYKEAVSHYEGQRFSEAKALLERLEADYSTTSTWRSASRMLTELGVWGTPCPEDWTTNIEHWFQGEGGVDLMSGTVLVVFWEEWCPHCVREVPDLQETWERLGARGLQVVGLTKVTRSSSRESVEEFLRGQDVGFPIAQEDGSLSTHFSVSGVPAAAVLREGVVVWRGHPARLNDALLGTWL